MEQHAQRARSTEFDIVRKGDVVKTRDGGRLAVSLDEPGVIRICRCRKERNAIIRAVRSHQVAIRGQNAEINARAIHARLIFSILYAHTDSEFLERIAIFARITERITFRRSVLHTDPSIRRGNGVLFIFAPTVGVPGLNLGLCGLLSARGKYRSGQFAEYQPKGEYQTQQNRYNDIRFEYRFVAFHFLLLKINILRLAPHFSYNRFFAFAHRTQKRDIPFLV